MADTPPHALHDAPFAPVPPPELPWEWFDLSGRPRLASAFSWQSPPLQTNTQTFAARFDGRLVPFKLLRDPAASGRQRPVLMLLHGMGLHIASFHDIARYLLPTHDLLLVDYSGFSGPAGSTAGGLSIRALAHAAMRVPAELGVTRYSVGGSSLGGGMALIVAVESPRAVQRVVLFNPACYPQRLPWFYRQVRVPLLGELLMAVLPAKQLSAGAGAVGYADKARFGRRLFEAYTRNMHAIRNRFLLMDLIRQLPASEREVSPYVARSREVRQPVLVIWGGQDRLLCEDTHQRLRADLPNVQLVLLEELSHLPHEEAPEQVGPIAAAFLN